MEVFHTAKKYDCEYCSKAMGSGDTCQLFTQKQKISLP